MAGMLDSDRLPRSSLATSLRTIALAEQLGFGRYWLTEHHVGNCAWGNPTSVVALLAASTNRIRVGTGGTLISTYRPAAVASDFALLGNIFPGRIDLGFARGSTTLGVEHDGLAPARLPMEEFGKLAREIVNRLHLTGEYEEGAEPPRRASIPRASRIPPECWVLGSSADSGRLAASLGTPFAVSLFHTKEHDVSGAAAYRAEFRDANASKSRLAVAVAGLCASSEADARRLFETRMLQGSAWPTVYGTADRVSDAIQQIQARYGPDEIVYLDLTRDPASRLRSIELFGRIVSDFTRRHDH